MGPGGGGGPGVLPLKILESLECRKSHLPQFLGLFFIFLFFINQFSLFFFCYSLKFSGYSFYMLSPHYSLIIFFFFFYYAYYSLISIKNGHYSLISKPHPDPRSCAWTPLACDHNLLSCSIFFFFFFFFSLIAEDSPRNHWELADLRYLGPVLNRARAPHWTLGIFKYLGSGIYI